MIDIAGTWTTRTLYLHIGYPHGCPDGLQGTLFPSLKSVRYEGRYIPPGSGEPFHASDLWRLLSSVAYIDTKVLRTNIRFIVDSLQFILSSVAETSEDGGERSVLVSDVSIFTRTLLPCKKPCIFDVYSYAEKLRALFAESNIRARFIFTIRRQREAILRQYVEEGIVTDINDFFPKSFFDMRMRFFEFFRYADVIGHYASIFGKENVLVLPAELLYVDRNAYISALSDFIDEPISEKAAGALSISGVLNKKVSKTALSFAPVLRFLPPALRDRLVFKSQEAGLSDFCMKWLRRYYSENNEKLEEMFGVRLGELGYFYRGRETEEYETEGVRREVVN